MVEVVREEFVVEIDCLEAVDLMIVIIVFCFSSVRLLICSDLEMACCEINKIIILNVKKYQTFPLLLRSSIVSFASLFSTNGCLQWKSLLVVWKFVLSSPRWKWLC